MQFSIKEHDILLFKKRRLSRLLAQRALKSGEINKAAICKICATETRHLCAHHTDYGKPLQVIWLCQKCHGLVHRKEHPLNPANHEQTPFPPACNYFKSVTVAFTIPVETFLALASQSEQTKKTISQLLREKTLLDFPVENRQFELKFEEKNDKPQNVPIERVSRMGTHQDRMPKPKQPNLPALRSKRNFNLTGMDHLFEFYGRHGADASRLQHSRVN